MKKNMRTTLVILAAMMMPMTMLAGCGEAKNMTEAAPAVVHDGGAVLNGAPSADAAPAKAPADAPAAESPARELTAEPAKKSPAIKADAPAAEAYRAEIADSAFAEAADAEMPARPVDAIKGEKELPVELPVEPEPDIPPTQRDIRNDAEAFVLTAGEWNDNANWGFFVNLLNNNRITFPAYGLDPANRVSAEVTVDGKPARNIPVELVAENGEVIWKAQTDRDGNAYLFCDSKHTAEKLTVRAMGQSAETEFTSVRRPQSEETATLNPTVKLEISEGAVPAYAKTEVMFILDTTGSMGDEILYLQKDFASIAEDTAGENVSFSMNFYRDKGDEYVTKTNPFSTDIKDLQTKLNQEFAGGGGDSPEAIAEILDETITNGQWSKDANKIAFLIFDAPPHNDKASIGKVQTAIQSAAAQGIHLVPVVASNSERETELFGRAAAAMTNSNYVFLTDDSGVGGSHLEPIIGSYDVEKLHDIIVRNIKEIAK